jgi:hypothetical protein
MTMLTKICLHSAENSPFNYHPSVTKMQMQIDRAIQFPVGERRGLIPDDMKSSFCVCEMPAEIAARKMAVLIKSLIKNNCAMTYGGRK